MKFIKATFTASLVLVSSSAIAWDMPWDDNDHRDRWHGHNRGDNKFDFMDDVWGDMFGDMVGDFDFEITVRANADGWGRGRGRGRGDNYWRGDHRYYGDNRYYGNHGYYGGRYGPYRPYYGPYRPYYGPYRQPGVYGAPSPVAPSPYGVATRQRPPATVPGPSSANRKPSSRPAPSRVTSSRDPRSRVSTAPTVSKRKHPHQLNNPCNSHPGRRRHLHKGDHSSLIINRLQYNAGNFRLHQ